MRTGALGVVLLVLGLLVGVGYQAAPLRTGTGIICQNRAETVPPGLDGKPYLSFRGSSYRVLPAELRCEWEIDGEQVVTRIGMNPGADLIAGVLLGAGAPLLLLAGFSRGRVAARGSRGPEETTPGPDASSPPHPNALR